VEGEGHNDRDSLRGRDEPAEPAEDQSAEAAVSVKKGLPGVLHEQCSHRVDASRGERGAEDQSAEASKRGLPDVKRGKKSRAI